MVQNHVDEGREAVNFSEWNRSHEEGEEVAEAVLEREMPPASYLLLHPEARLSASERDQLARGLGTTLGGMSRESGGAAEREDGSD